MVVYFYFVNKLYLVGRYWDFKLTVNELNAAGSCVQQSMERSLYLSNSGEFKRQTASKIAI